MLSGGAQVIHKTARAPFRRLSHQEPRRTILTEIGHSLADALANPGGSSRVDRVLRNAKRNLLGARINLASEEGSGDWELTRIRDEESDCVP